MKKSIIFVIFLLLLKVSIAATIHGTVYDTSLLPINKAIVEINTQPKQTIVTQNGQYSFNVPIGEYTITAEANINNEFLSENQSINVKDNGDYVLDLILLPEIEDFEDNLDFEIEPVVGEIQKQSKLWIIIPIVIILIILFLIKKRKKPPEKEIKEVVKKEAIEEKTEEILQEDEELNKIYNIIKEAKRITQKDIRKQTGLSEAKISLVISQLESEGKIKKIKKGRTNIIILQ